MLGNDIVDLTEAKKQSNIFRSRYFDKTLTASEQYIVQQSVNPELCFWTIWTCKEAVYKSAQREFCFKAFYNPLQFQTHFLTEDKAKICFNKKVYDIDIKLNSNFIYSYTSNNFKTDYHIQPTQSLTLKKISNNFNQPVSLKKNEIGLPYLEFYSHQKICSVTHHGSFFALQYMC
ncbi:4'-phosphopantetheinyl transferase superfamily protein [Psychroflexus sp. ALD_RP9]|uniref:4'-phosphopantetheinyl transferase family protein n=1 Tax=Psychroflexus sp. ALD_RP9 TaxID=2777186 RepID=UPI001A8EC20E|nr:4'-phosphopantetheinyl transferase superfamily protein [Psychroflexus sp. ALD_RP9]QSS97009.1 4'-phosphopantetheinyl transferase superfamily protein [Psychroflexus sp. ALD_RP9]